MRGWRMGIVSFIVTGLLFALSAAQSTPPPGVAAEFVVETFPVYQKGSLAEPQIAGAKLTVRADAFIPQPLDVIIGIDRALNLDEARPFIERLMNLLGPDDRVGLVSLAPSNLDNALTADFNLVRQRLSELVPGASTGLGEALAIGNKELTENGRTEARKIQIWLVARAGLDRSDFGPVLFQAQRARDRQITVHAVTTTDATANSTTLISLVHLTSGILIKGLNDESLTMIQNQLRYEFVARKVIAKITVTARVTFEGAEGTPEIQEFSDGSKTLTWSLDTLRPEETYDFKFSISSAQKGQFPVNRSPSTVEYTNILGQRAKINVPFILLDVPNAAPVAKFDFNPEITGFDRAAWKPAAKENIVFTDQSSDPDGTVASYLWDFGDGTTSTEQYPIHAYEKSGEYTAQLTVTDNENGTGTATVAMQVLSVAVATRDLPTLDGKLPRGIFVRVYLEVRVTRDVLGLGIQEQWPDGMISFDVKVADVTGAVFGESHGGTFKAPPPGGTTVEWIFPERLAAGTTKRIVYELKLAETAEIDSPLITGFVISKIPDIQVSTEGANSFELVESLPIRVIVAHYIADPNTSPEEERIDPKDDNLISWFQVQKAVGWWLATGWATVSDPTTVPGTGGQKIDLAAMQEIISYWLSNTPIDQPLPAQPALPPSPP